MGLSAPFQSHFITFLHLVTSSSRWLSHTFFFPSKLPTLFSLLTFSYNLVPYFIEKIEGQNMLPQPLLTCTCAHIFDLPTTSHNYRVDVWASVQAKPFTCTLEAIHQPLLWVNMSKTVYLIFPFSLLPLIVFPWAVNGNSITPHILAQNLNHSWLLSLISKIKSVCKYCWYFVQNMLFYYFLLSPMPIALS